MKNFAKIYKSWKKAKLYCNMWLWGDGGRRGVGGRGGEGERARGSGKGRERKGRGRRGREAEEGGGRRGGRLECWERIDTHSNILSICNSYMYIHSNILHTLTSLPRKYKQLLHWVYSIYSYVQCNHVFCIYHEWREGTLLMEDFFITTSNCFIIDSFFFPDNHLDNMVIVFVIEMEIRSKQWKRVGIFLVKLDPVVVLIFQTIIQSSLSIIKTLWRARLYTRSLMCKKSTLCFHVNLWRISGVNLLLVKCGENPRITYV